MESSFNLIDVHISIHVIAVGPAEDAFVFTSRKNDPSQFMPKHTAKRHSVQRRTLENRMLQRVGLYNTQVLR